MTQPDERRRYQPLGFHPEMLDRIEQIEGYASRLLPFIPRGLPVYQSHGVNHSLSIIHTINSLTAVPDLQINPAEAFLLYLAAWLHDLGYLHPLSIYDRGMHTELSLDMIDRDPTIQRHILPSELSLLGIIVRYHDTHTNLTAIRETSSNVRISLITALFRIADAIDIGTDRCPPEVFELISDGLNEHSRRHWQAHQNVIGIRISYPVIIIMVRDPENPFFRRRVIAHLQEDCMTANLILKRFNLSPVTIECRKEEGTR